jgi:hypothetical protein
MASKSTVLIAGMATLSMAAAGLATPAFAAPAAKFDHQRLDAASADYSYYRGYRSGWRGGRGAAVAAGVGVGLLGAAALAASRPAYADPYYVDDGYSYYAPSAPVYYEPAPVYEAPVYAPRQYYEYRGPVSRSPNRNGTTDPARGGR